MRGSSYDDVNSPIASARRGRNKRRAPELPPPVQQGEEGEGADAGGESSVLNSPRLRRGPRAHGSDAHQTPAAAAAPPDPPSTGASVTERVASLLGPVLKLFGGGGSDDEGSVDGEAEEGGRRSAARRLALEDTSAPMETEPESGPESGGEAGGEPESGPESGGEDGEGEEEEDEEEEHEHEEEEEEQYEEFNPFLFMKQLPPYREVQPSARPFVLPAKTRQAPPISLILDLDETLVHCSIDTLENPDLVFPVHYHGATYQAFVRKRPYLEQFLQTVAPLFEVIIFTASQQVYAEKLLNILDPKRQLIKYRLYRDACLPVDGTFLKDLSVLGRDLSKVVIVDNSPHAFGYQVNNGIPIESWFDDPQDTELLKLIPFLQGLLGSDDVRPVLRDQFRIQQLIDTSF